MAIRPASHRCAPLARSAAIATTRNNAYQLAVGLRNCTNVSADIARPPTIALAPMSGRSMTNVSADWTTVSMARG